jgi:hypothetical protein
MIRRMLEIEGFTRKLEDLNFSKQGTLWVPPADLAMGSVFAVNEAAAVGGSGWSAQLFMELNLKRLGAQGMQPILKSGLIPVLGSFNWYPTEPIDCRGQKLTSINVFAQFLQH